MMLLKDLPYTTADLFPPGDFAFHMRFRRGDVPAFYKNSGPPEILAERKKWIVAHPERYTAALPGAEQSVHEALELARSLGISVQPGATVADSMRNLACAWEPDLLVLRAPSPALQPRLLAGAVCFPSSWALGEKMGEPLDSIHAPVPTLNESFANPVQQFLARIKPGISWERINWGLSRSPELNQHPARQLPRLDASVDLNQVWFRAEYQSLIALPKTNAVLFGIRLAIEPLSRLLRDQRFSEGMANALRTMPPSIGAYKGITAARERLLQQIEGFTAVD